MYMNSSDFNSSALLFIKLATLQCGTTPRNLSYGVSGCIRIDNSISNHHLVSGVDYLISAGLREDSIPLFANEVKKKIYLEDITEITPIGADKILITLKLNDEIYEAYCTEIKYGVIDEDYHRPQYWKSFINLSGPDIAIEHLNKHYKHSVCFFNDALESSSILSIEPYIEKDLIVTSNFSDWPNPYSAREEYFFRNIEKLSININRLSRTISIFDSFEKENTQSDHDGGVETTKWNFHMSCTIKYGSIQRLESQLRRWEENGISISNGSISFPHLRYWEIETKLGIRFSFSNSCYTFPA